MSDPRVNVLARVREALRTAGAAVPPVAAASPPPPAPAAETPDPVAIVDRFGREATAVGCTVHGPVAGAETTDVVVSILREAHAHRLLVWGADALPVADLGLRLAEKGFALLDPTLAEDGAGRRTQLARLDEADVGLTGAVAGLADTGTIVVKSGPSRARLAWLLPPVHVALLETKRIFPGLPEFLSSARPLVAESANVTLVTGPSRTGDIEMILTRGVHGPGVVHVVLVESSST